MSFDPEVFQLVHPFIDQGKLLLFGKQLLGRSLSQGIDSIKDDLGPLASFLCILDEFQNDRKADPIGSLRKAGAILYHLSVSLLFVTDGDLRIELLENTKLNMLGHETVRPGLFGIVASGSLDVWRDCIINLSTGDESWAARQLMNKTLAVFTKMGIGALWQDYRKDGLVDGTFRLTASSK